MCITEILVYSLRRIISEIISFIGNIIKLRNSKQIAIVESNIKALTNLAEQIKKLYKAAGNF